VASPHYVPFVSFASLLYLSLGRNEYRRNEYHRVIRVAFVIPTLDQSGAERQLTMLASALPKDEYEVQVIALNRGGPYADQLLAAGIKVEVLGKRFRFDSLTYMRLRSALHRFQPQIIQSFLFAANSYMRMPGMAPAGSRIIVSERCVDSWKSGWQLGLDRRLVARTNAMTANSESVAAFYEQIGMPREKIVVIPNAMPLQSPEYSREKAREILGLSPAHKVTGFVGRLAPQKRLKDVIWAFQLLQQVVDNVRLVLIGAGPERDELADLANNFGCRNMIIFAEHRADAFSLMKAFDAFVLASEFEGMSNSLMEAMSLGIPCVVSDIPPNLELVTNERTGLTFPLGKGPELAKVLIRLLQDSDLAKQLGEAGQRLIADRHSVETMVQHHQRLYKRLLQ
jgi:glycosyltransferase involved in cell wall biosynthesis